jgi:hypothetical protein
MCGYVWYACGMLCGYVYIWYKCVGTYDMRMHVWVRMVCMYGSVSYACTCEKRMVCVHGHVRYACCMYGYLWCAYMGLSMHAYARVVCVDIGISMSDLRF